MKEKTDKIFTLALLGLGVLCAVLAFFFAQNTANGGLFDVVYWVLGAFIGVSILAAIFFMFKSLYEKGNLVKFFIGVAAIAALFVVLYLISKGNDIPIAWLENKGATEQTSKMIGALCYVVYLCVIGAIGLIAFSEIAKSIKKK